MRIVITLVTITVLTILAYTFAAITGRSYEEAIIPVLVGAVSVLYANSITKGSD